MSKKEPTIQARVKELLRPGFFGKKVRRVRLIQTHTSWVFLTGEFAYKVKKPVNFGFLDYTTLSARKFFCKEEFRLNCQLSPDIYIEVATVTESGSRLRLGGRGRVIDYALKMRELPQASIMTERLKRDGVTFKHIDEIARTISKFHDHAESGREISRYGSFEIIKLNWDENFAQTIEFRGKTITYRAFDEIKAAVERFIKEKRYLFRYRRERGYVRKCHGDLHSRNIFTGDRVHIFDCIEFNPRFSCSDVASEIAFMVMDLEYFGRKDLADFFVERYLVYSKDVGLLRLLNFYKCYRAYVRGKVTSFNLNDPGIQKKAKSEAKIIAQKYFKLSKRYASQLQSVPKLVVMVGLPGTGKTYLARRLASHFDAFHLMSDSIRKQLLGIPVGTHKFEGPGKGIYTRNVSKKTYAEMIRRARVFLSAGHNVVLDATFLHEDSRQTARALAKRIGVPILFVYAYCPERTVIARMRRRVKEHSFSDADIEVYRAMKSRFTPPKADKNLVRIDTRQPIGTSLGKIERTLLHF